MASADGGPVGNFQSRCLVGGSGHGPAFETVKMPLPRGREVLVELRAAGICRTDIDAIGWQGRHILGHEGAGIVRAVGSAVRSISRGDRVAFNWAIPCGECRSCRTGSAYLCASDAANVGPHPQAPSSPRPPLLSGQPIDRLFDLGSLSQFALVDCAAVICLPDSIDFAEAAILGCAVMTGAGSVWNIAGVGPGESVTVIGCGSVGLNAVQAARIAGATTIIALDRRDSALNRAKQFGATKLITIDGNPHSLEAAASEARQLTAGGCDYALDSTGDPALAFAPLSFIRNGGTAVQMSGFDPGTIAHELLLDPFLWNKKFIVALYGACIPERDFPRLFSLHKRGQLMLSEQIAKLWPFEQAQDAFEAADSGAGKQVLLFDPTAT